MCTDYIYETMGVSLSRFFLVGEIFLKPHCTLFSPTDYQNQQLYFFKLSIWLQLSWAASCWWMGTSAKMHASPNVFLLVILIWVHPYRWPSSVSAALSQHPWKKTMCVNYQTFVVDVYHYLCRTLPLLAGCSGETIILPALGLVILLLGMFLSGKFTLVSSCKRQYCIHHHH